MCVGVYVTGRQTVERDSQVKRDRQTKTEADEYRDTSEIDPCVEDGDEDHEDVSRLCRRMRNKSACSSCSTQCSVHAHKRTRSRTHIFASVGLHFLIRTHTHTIVHSRGNGARTLMFQTFNH